MADMGAKRLYLCNLIPLWRLDDERLDVDWAVGRARTGDYVELRVVVHDLPLSLDPPDFKVRFDIKESDFLLSGGLDDRMAQIQGPDGGNPGAEVRPFKVVDGRDPAFEERLEHIFLTRLSAEEGPAGALIRCFWRAEYQEDVFGHPEYYFDFTLETNDEKLEERSDRELEVRRATGGFGEGLGVRSSELQRAAVLGIPPAPIVRGVGWSKPAVALGEKVEMMAVVEGSLPGNPITFEILGEATDEGQVLERVDSVIEADGVQRVDWAPPRPFPIPELTELALRAYVEYVPDRIAYSASGTFTVDGEHLRLEGRLALQADLKIDLVDEAGDPQVGIEYRLESPEGEVVVEGTTDARGRIAVPRLSGMDYRIRLGGVCVLDVVEPETPQRPPPETDGLVLSVVEILPPEPVTSSGRSSEEREAAGTGRGQ